MKFNRSNIPVAEENMSLVAVAVRIWVAGGSVLVTIRSQSSIPEFFWQKQNAGLDLPVVVFATGVTVRVTMLQKFSSKS